MKKLIAVAVLAIALVGCAPGAKPSANYDPAWCELSEFATKDGTTIWIYTSPQGNLVVARNKDGKIVAAASGRYVTSAVDDVLQALSDGR